MSEGYYVINLKEVPTLGDNGFFIRRGILLKADIEHYFHIDVCQDLFNLGYKTYAVVNASIWHKTGGSILRFFMKRLKYADKFSEGRRWKMVTKKDIPRLIFFILSSLTIIYPLYISFKGYSKIRDKAWFLHLIVCWLTIGGYSLWMIKKLFINGIRNLGKKS
jgi:GT2 family glycosyltransferase